jgi:hypothetical protein
MATAKLTITDSPTGVVVVVESTPPIPMVPGQSMPDPDKLTDAQAAAVYAAAQLHEACGTGEWRTLFT